MHDQLSDEYQCYAIEEISVMDDTLTLKYGGHVFGGIVRCLLDPNGVEAALRPGTEIFVRYHYEETGERGQVAHIITNHPLTKGWTELYSDTI